MVLILQLIPLRIRQNTSPHAAVFVNAGFSTNCAKQNSFVTPFEGNLVIPHRVEKPVLLNPAKIF